MRSKNKLLLFLLLAPPLAEFITGSTPLSSLLNPIILFFFVLLYGIGNLLIREARVRWNLQWSVIFLATVYGIFEEGFLMQSFFNTGHEDLGALSNFGMYFGVQWPWTIALILLHATISTLIPLFIADTIWPELKHTQLLGRKGFLLSFVGIAGLIIFEFSLMKYMPMFSSYVPSKLLLFITLVIMGFLVLLAYLFRDSMLISKGKILSSFLFFIFGFLFQSINQLLPNILAANSQSAEFVLLLQFILITTAVAFTYKQLLNENATVNHLILFVIGNIFFFNLVTFLSGMVLVSIITLLLLIIWRKNVLNKF